MLLSPVGVRARGGATAGKRTAALENGARRGATCLAKGYSGTPKIASLLTRESEGERTRNSEKVPIAPSSPASSGEGIRSV